ncbi:MAG: phenylacetate-CoA oxygenase subunit PaaI [Balneolaceae bacterium]|nr:MAG: phenylacetate-CoA oxygenase subunit PaaI [Balneolaceae bacterium]
MSTLETIPNSKKEVLVEILLRLADDRLILGHRLSEWAGHAPELEEDLALANIALDMIGHASALYGYAAQLEDKPDEDHYAYFRDDIDFKNIALTELPRGDFAFTTARLFLFSTFSYLLYNNITQVIEEEQFNGIIKKHFNEIKYHLRHSREWVLRLGDGTDLSKLKIQQAIDDLWMYTGEMFETDKTENLAAGYNLFIDVPVLKNEWMKWVTETLEEATLKTPDNNQYMFTGSRQGRHTEHLGRLLAEMQFLRRSYPDADWK